MNYEKFKFKCKEKGYSPSGLLTKLGISKGNVSKWKNGANPSYDTLIKLSEELECSVGYLMDLEDGINSPGPTVRHALRTMKETPYRTISLESDKSIEKKYLDEIVSFANTNVFFLYDSTMQEYVPEDSERKEAEISRRGFDILLGIFDHVNEGALLKTIQLQLSKIVLHHLEVTTDTEIKSDFLKGKINYILTGKENKDSLQNHAFNFSDLLTLGDYFDKSLYFMFSGIE